MKLEPMEYKGEDRAKVGENEIRKGKKKVDSTRPGGYAVDHRQIRKKSDSSSEGRRKQTGGRGDECRWGNKKVKGEIFRVSPNLTARN